MKKSRLFIDTNIVLDLLGERKPFYEQAAQIATLADKGEIELIVSALSFATVNYVLTKYENAASSKNKLRQFKIISRICGLSEQIINKGLNSKFPDFEDALQYFSAVESKCNVLITRNGKDFKLSQIPVLTPEEFLKSYFEKH
ncbi:MAG: PIN domain-containing protein [Prolixibacteraceae bacterium]|nr:PIN domain-containing protein [Prolixibacteraceae bacterium]